MGGPMVTGSVGTGPGVRGGSPSSTTASSTRPGRHRSSGPLSTGARAARRRVLGLVVASPLLLAPCLPLSGDTRATGPAPAVDTAAARAWTGERAAAASTARLSGAADAYARAAALDALALAEAATDTSRAARDLDAPEAERALLRDLEEAQDELSRLTAERRGTQPVPAPRGVALVDTSGPGPAPLTGLDVRAELATATELTTAAEEVFGLALRLEVATQEADAAKEAERWTGLEELETLADAAAGLADEAAEPDTSAVRTVAFAVGRWRNGQIPLEELCRIDVAPAHLLRCDAAEALDRLAAAYRADTGRELVVVSSYRTYDEQVLLRRSKGWLAAPPGRSQHGLGVAVDLGDMGGLGEFDAPAYRWMKRHAGAFGWHHLAAMEPGGSGPPEPWHWEYTG